MENGELYTPQEVSEILAVSFESGYSADENAGLGTQNSETMTTLAIGGVVALVGGVMFALGWQREDAEGKSRGLMTMMAGFMVIAIAMSKDIFGL